MKLIILKIKIRSILSSGGEKDCYQNLKPIFEAASAKINGDPCVAYLGNTSSGHYVKMIHNGIEYAIMQLISEKYHILKYGLKKSNKEIHEVFKSWNEGVLESYPVSYTHLTLPTKLEV